MIRGRLKYRKKLYFSTLWLNFLSASLVLIGSVSVKAGDGCLDYLSKVENQAIINLPGKGHSFSNATLAKLKPQNQYRVALIKRAISVLDRSEVVDAISVINQPLKNYVPNPESIVIPESLKSIIETHPGKDVSVENYRFFKSVLGTSFSDDTIIGLSLLFNSVDRPSGNFRPIEYGQINPDQISKYNSMMQNLVSRPQIAAAILRFLCNGWVIYQANIAMETLRQSYVLTAETKIKALSFSSGYSAPTLDYGLITKFTTFDPENLDHEYKTKKKFSPQSVLIITTILERYSDLFMMEFLKSLGLPAIDQNDYLDGVEILSNMDRPKRLALIENYLAENAGFKSHLGNLVNFMDHFTFGAAFPLKAEELEIMIISSVKLWLMPVRAEVSQLKAEETLAVQTALEIQHRRNIQSTQILNSLWGHAPLEPEKPKPNRQNPNKRRNRHEQPKTGTKTQSVVELDLIPKSANLLSFSPLVEDPRPISDLDPEKTYSFRFMQILRAKKS